MLQTGLPQISGTFFTVVSVMRTRRQTAGNRSPDNSQVQPWFGSSPLSSVLQKADTTPL
jgi:hypothetical protein